MARVLVIGGGPSGATFAARMAMLGHAVTLVERARFPRRHVGESLSPGVMPLLATIGADQAMASAGFRAVEAVRTHWDGAPTIRRDPGARGLIVDRGRFDQLLLEHARSRGVRIHQPARIVQLARQGNRWAATLTQDGGTTSLQAEFLVHATGRGQGSRTGAGGPRTIALHGWWQGSSLALTPGITAGDTGWFWEVPLPDGCSNLLAFVDARALRAMPHATLQQRYRHLLASGGILAPDSPAEPLGPVEAIDASPLLHPDPVSPTAMRIGDAAMALDPLSSSGVQKAIQNALSGAIVAHTLLDGGDGQAAMAFHRTSLAAAATRHAGWAAGHYARAAASRPDRFWADRAAGAEPEPPADPAPAMPSAHQPMAMSPEARMLETPCLDATRVTRRLALCHPRLDGPVAFLGGVELAPLVARIQPGQTVLDMAHSWTDRVPLAKSLAIAGWLVEKQILVQWARVGRARAPSETAGVAATGEGAGLVF